MSTGNGERGSILLFALFVCLAIAVLVQTLTVVVICADRATEAEDTGRGLMREHDEALSSVRRELLTNWAPRGLSWVGEGSAQVSTQVSEVPESAGWVLDASVAHAETVSPIGVSAWVERGRDGLDLPLAGLVAQSAAWPGERATPVMEMDGVPSTVAQAGSPADGLAEWLVAEPGAPPLGVGLTAGVLRAPWKLDDGWRRFLGELQGEQAGGEGVVPTAEVVVLHGPTGDTVTLPDGGESPPAGRSCWS